MIGILNFTTFQNHCYGDKYNLSWSQQIKKYRQVNISESEVTINTLESGINVAPWINVAPGKFGKKNKCSPIYALLN